MITNAKKHIRTARNLVGRLSTKTYNFRTNSGKIDKCVRRLDSALRAVDQEDRAAAETFCEEAFNLLKRVKTQKDRDRGKQSRAKSRIKKALVILEAEEGPLFGPWIQDLLGWSKADRNLAIQMAAELGCTAMGFNGLQFGETPGLSASDIASNGDLSRLKPAFLANIAETAQAIVDAGMVPYVWGLPWPSVRRNAIYEFNWKGAPIQAGHWNSWAPVAREAGMHCHAEMVRVLPIEAQTIDGVEPHAGRDMPAGPPANAFQRDIQIVDRGCIQGDGGPFDDGRSDQFMRPDVHSNPGSGAPPHGNSVRWGISCSDGWGTGSNRNWEDGRGYAGLPSGNLQEVVAWFVQEYKTAREEDREAYFVLHTTSWGVKNRQQALDGWIGGDAPEQPMLFRTDVQPFGEAYEGMAQEAGTANVLRGAEIINGDKNIADWPVTATLDEVNITEDYIEHVHSGDWPLFEGTKSNGDTIMLEGNVWVGAEIDGTFYFSTYEFIGPESGEKRKKSLNAEDYGKIGEAMAAHTEKVPLKSWSPEIGDKVYFFSSSLARGSDRSEINQRTNVVCVEWPV